MNQHSSGLVNWLEKLEKLHPSEIELGLDRVRRVAHSAGLLSVQCPVITVAGTNGKGSVVAFLTAIYNQAGYNTGSYTSPHIRSFNERIRINGDAVSDIDIVHAFEDIERVRNSVPLTYFEFSTLAAISVCKKHQVDVLILEVGLGGRLDAVNIVDADVSIITSIALDHESWLGSTREEIAIEKAGIARQSNPLVIGDRDMPLTLEKEAKRIGAEMHCIQKDFDYSLQGETWDFLSRHSNVRQLPKPALAGEWQYANASVSICAAMQLQNTLPLEIKHFQLAMQSVALAGRYQRIIFQGIPLILDVGHNPAAVRGLADQLSNDFPAGVRAVFAVMQDKAIREIVEVMLPVTNTWYLIDLDMARAMKPEKLATIIHKVDSSTKLIICESSREALNRAVLDAEPSEALLVFGSFFTLAQVSELID